MLGDYLSAPLRGPYLDVKPADVEQFSEECCWCGLLQRCFGPAHRLRCRMCLKAKPDVRAHCLLLYVVVLVAD